MRKSYRFFFSIVLLILALLPRCLGISNSEVERTLAIIKPDGILGNYTDEIKRVIVDSGFTILREMMVQLDEGNATLFYSEHSEQIFFQSLIKYMTSGPIYVMVLEKVNAISEWRTMIGPTNARQAQISHPKA